MNTIMITVGIVLVAIVLLLVGCKSTITEKVLNKSYDIVCKTECYVESATSTNVYNSLKRMEKPLKITASAMELIASKVSSEDVKYTLNNIAEKIKEITAKIEAADETKIEELRVQVLQGLQNAKRSIESIAELLDIELTVEKFVGVDADEIEKDSMDLAKMIK